MSFVFLSYRPLCLDEWTTSDAQNLLPKTHNTLLKTQNFFRKLIVGKP
jgi:hypothetical protein